jgi:RNA polymerase sigma factor (sigma-70 family)
MRIGVRLTSYLERTILENPHSGKNIFSGCVQSPAGVAFTNVKTPDPTNAELNHEQEALKALASQFGPVLLQYFKRRIGDRFEAADLMQEVFVRLIRRGNMAALQDIRGYIFETASSVLTDRARKRRSRHTDDHESFDPTVHGVEGFPSDRVLIGEETLSRASRALLELPERARTIFVLRRLEGLRYQDIAQRLGISLSLVEKQMARAVAYLTQRMNDE